MKKTQSIVIAMTLIIALAILASSCGAVKHGCYATRKMSGY
jgi:hypothetical protein